VLVFLYTIVSRWTVNKTYNQRVLDPDILVRTSRSNWICILKNLFGRGMWHIWPCCWFQHSLSSSYSKVKEGLIHMLRRLDAEVAFSVTIRIKLKILYQPRNVTFVEVCCQVTAWCSIGMIILHMNISFHVICVTENALFCETKYKSGLLNVVQRRHELLWSVVTCGKATVVMCCYSSVCW